MSYDQDRRFADQFIPLLRALIGPHLLCVSSLEQDRHEASDLVLRARDLTIACRVRRAGYALSFPREFTIRSHRDSGAPTELEKITNGWAKWFFYGHAQDSQTIAPWFLIDLDAWRSHMIRARKQVRCGKCTNDDGTGFCWFDIDSFPPNPPLLIAEGPPPETSEATDSAELPW